MTDSDRKEEIVLFFLPGLVGAVVFATAASGPFVIGCLNSLVAVVGVRQGTFFRVRFGRLLIAGRNDEALFSFRVSGKFGMSLIPGQVISSSRSRGPGSKNSDSCHIFGWWKEASIRHACCEVLRVRP